MGKTNSKRLLCLLLSLALVFTLISVPVYADTGDTSDTGDENPTEQVTEEETEELIDEPTEEEMETPTEEETEAPTDEPTEEETEEPTSVEENYGISLTSTVEGETEDSTFPEAGEDGVITLTSNVTLSENWTVSGTVTLDLAGYTLDLGSNRITVSGGANLTINDTVSGGIVTSSNTSRTITVNGGTLTVNGGTIVNSGTYGGWGCAAIGVFGSTDSAANDYSTVTVNTDAKLKTTGGDSTANPGYGVAVYYNSGVATNYECYGVTVNIFGQCENAYLYVNGSITESVSSITFNLDGATITGQYGIYAAGYATWNISNTTIEGVASGIEIRAGVLNVKESTITASSTDSNTVTNWNGATVTGAGIAVSQHSTNQAITVDIEDSVISGYYGVREVNTNLTTSAAVSITIGGSSIVSTTAESGAAVLSDNYTDSMTTVAVTGGTYNTDVSAYTTSTSAAVATEDDDGNTVYTVITTAENAVALVYDADGTIVNSYDSLTEAFTNTKDGYTIKLIDDYSVTEATYNGDGYYQVSGKVVTLDLGGYTLSVDTTRILGVKNGGTLNVENGTVEIAEGTTSSYTQFNMVRGNSKFTATGVTFDANSIGSYAVYIAASAVATVEMTNCTFTDLNNAVVFDADNASTVTLTGCNYTKQPFSTSTFGTIENYTVVITKNSPSTDCYEDNNTIFFNYIVEDGGVINKDTISLSKYFGSASLTVKEGGTVTANVKVNDDTSMSVEGGSVTGTITVAKEGAAENAVLLASANDYTITGGCLTITGGTITGQVKSSGTLIMKDGTVTDGGTEYADGVIYILNGNVYVEGGTVVGTKRGFGFAGTGTINGEISGGSITGSDIALMVRANETNTVKVSGGSYTATNALYLANESDDSTIFADGCSAYNTDGEALTSTISGDVTLYKSALSDKTVVVDIAGRVCQNTTTGTSYTKLQDAIDAASSGDEIKLLADVTENLIIASDDNITLDLAGRTLTGSGGYAIDVEGGKFTLKDSVGDGKVTRSDSTGYVIYVESLSTKAKASFTLESGTITGGTTGGIWARSGSSNYKVTVNINGGSITDCGTNGVYTSKYATVTMTGGTISYNKRGVFLASTSYPSTFTMSGGTISNNTSTDLNGGGVFVGSGNKFVMTGGIITDNSAAIGGGVYADTKSNSYYFRFSGGAIYGNTATDNGNDIYATNVNTYSNATILNASSMTDVSYKYWRSASTGELISDTATLSGTVYLTAVTGDETYDTYTITYNANGGTGTVPTDSTAYTAKMIATAAAADDLTREGYYFTGWNTDSDGSGTSCKAGGSITVTDDITLYAQWAETIAIMYDSSKNVVGYYSSLADAVKAVSDSSAYTIVLQKDYTTSDRITDTTVNTRNVTIDLNGHTYTSTDSSYAISINNSGYTLTITDSVGGGKIETTTSDALAILATRGTLNVTGNLTISGATTGIQMGGYSKAYSTSQISNVNISESAVITGGSYGIVILGSTSSTASDYGPVLTVNGGTISGSDFGISGNGSYSGLTTININGGTISATNTAIYHPQNGTLNITDGTITGSTGIEMRSGTLNVSGGTITGTSTDFKKAPNGSGTTVVGAGIAVSQHSTDNEVTVNVTDGTISGYYGIYEWNTFAGTNTSEVSITISGDSTNVNSTTDEGGEAIKCESVAADGETTAASSITTVAISGGSFSSPVDSEYCAEDYIPTVLSSVTDDDGNVTYIYGVIKFALGIYGSDTTVAARIASGEGTSTMYVKVSGDYIGTDEYYSTTAYPTTSLTYTSDSDTDSGEYIFAGWYTLEEDGSYTACTSSMWSSTDETTYYAKFVDANTLKVKGVVTVGSEEDGDEGTNYWRFVTGLDSLNYDDIGFEAYLGENETKLDFNVYYYRTYTVYGADNRKFTADEFGSCAEWVASGLYADESSYSSCKIRAYWTTSDGSTVYGNWYNYTYSNGSYDLTESVE